MKCSDQDANAGNIVAPPNDEEFLERICTLFVGDHKLDGPQDILPAARIIQELAARFLPPADRDAALERVREYAEFIAERVREHVNPARAYSPDRRELNEFVEQNYFFKNIRHLELGTYDAFPLERVERLKAERGIGEFIRLDLSEQFAPDVVADCTHLPFRDGSIDSISSNSLFEHVADPRRIIEESFRVLSPGGVMQVTMPFHFVQHYCPKDYVRLAPHFFEDVCREVGFERVACHVDDFAGVYYVLHNCSKAALIDSAVPEAKRSFYKALHHNVVALLALATVFDDGFQGRGAQFFHSVYCVAVKAGRFRPRPPGSTAAPILPRILPFLACPLTHAPLLLTGDMLRREGGSPAYRIHQGIPLLLVTPSATDTKPLSVRQPLSDRRLWVRRILSRIWNERAS